MPNLITRKQLANLIGQTSGYVGMYVHRGNLIEENKRIDTDNPKNKAFIAKHTTISVIKEGSNNNDNKSINPSEKINQGNIDYIIKQHDLQLKSVKIKREALELDKRKAKVLPLDFVIEWSGRNMRGSFGETINFANSIIEQICNELNSDTDVKLKYKKLFKMGFNDILKNGIKNQEPEALSYAKEYSLNTKW